MSSLKAAVGQYVFLAKAGLAALVELLKQEGYAVVAPSLREGVISLSPIDSIEQLARGLVDEQSPGRYRTADADPESYFQYVVGPDSPKRYVFPPQMLLFRMRPANGTFAFEAGPPNPPKLALLAIRPCDVAALKMYDRAFKETSRCESDGYYRQVRKQMVVVVVNCTHPGGTCFCASMGTGPQTKDGFDLSMTELRSGFVMKVGSARGAQLAAALEVREPSPAELELADLRMEQAREHMGRSLPDAQSVRDLLARSIEHPHWDEVARRCLACGNCTMVCPTCLCSGVVDASDLTGGGVSRSRVWDSCYMHQFSYTTAGPSRSSIRARHRHWLRHKLSTTWDQIGCSGCVGCGRCITWCPVGIDLTQEVASIRGNRPTPSPAIHTSEVMP